MGNSIEDQVVEILEDFKKKMRHACEDVISAAYGDILPHVASDTEYNAAGKARRAVESILRGDITHDGACAIVTVDGIDMRIGLDADTRWSLCSALIQSMPECPKDRRIAALEEENQRLIDERFNRF